MEGVLSDAEHPGGLLAVAVELPERVQDVPPFDLMAMRCGMTSRDIKKSIFAYPTVSSDMPHML